MERTAEQRHNALQSDSFLLGWGSATSHVEHVSSPASSSQLWFHGRCKIWVPSPCLSQSIKRSEELR